MNGIFCSCARVVLLALWGMASGLLLRVAYSSYSYWRCTLLHQVLMPRSYAPL